MKGKEKKFVTVTMQEAIPGFGGTLRFERPDTLDYARPEGGGSWHTCWPSATAPPILSYPWGKARLYQIRESWYTSNVTPVLSCADPNTWSAAERANWELPENHSITMLYPRKSAEILQVSGLVSTVANYRDDRGASNPWNDAWGNPLVVSYGLYQPTEYGPPTTPDWTTGMYYVAGEWVMDGGKRWICIKTHPHDDPATPLPTNEDDVSKATNRPGTTGGLIYWVEALQKKDYYLKESLRLYRSNRATWFAVGAVGPTLDSTRFPSGLPAGQSAATWNTYLDRLWSQIIEGTITLTGKDWTEAGFDNPPWDGILSGKNRAKNWRCLLSAPKEME
jgi:hypothetical protein